MSPPAGGNCFAWLTSNRNLFAQARAAHQAGNVPPLLDKKKHEAGLAAAEAVLK